MNRSYGCSKSTESEILQMLAKIRGVKKKRHGYNFTFQVLPLNQHQNIPIWQMLIQYGSLKRKIVAVVFFGTVSHTVSQQQFQPRMQITQDFIFDKLICYSYVQEYVIK